MGHYSLHTPARCTRFFYMFLYDACFPFRLCSLSPSPMAVSRVSPACTALYICLYSSTERIFRPPRIAKIEARRFRNGNPVSPFRFRSTDEGRHHDTRDALYGFTLLHTWSWVLRVPRLAPVSPLFQTQRESQTARHMSFLTQTVAHSHLPEGGARVTDAAGTLPHR